MTISTTTTRVAYDGNGATTAFAVPFPFFASSELEVIERNVASGSETTLALGLNYTVAGGDGATGTVTAASAPAAGLQWVIRRKTARTQATDYTPNDPFPAETHEKALDRLTMIAQELGETGDRALKFPKTDSATLSSTLPPSVDRAGKVLAFDASGNPALSNLTLVTLEAQPSSAATSAAAAAASATAASASAGNASISAGAAQAAQTAAEAAASGMKWRPSVRAASTANVNLASAPASLDGVAGAAGDRWLLKDQTASSQNGVYVFNGTGAALTRAADADTWAELVSQVVAVEQGAVNADFTYICTVDQGGTIGTTAVTWASFKITFADGSVTLVKLADVPQASVIGRAIGAGTGAPASLTAAQVAAIVGGAGQVPFPATQSPSSDPNTLDDYEEGAWTPVDASGAGLTLGAPVGQYVKLGKSVIAWFNFVMPATANTFACSIGGLPFIADAFTSSNYAGALGLTDMGTALTTLVLPGGAALTFFNLSAIRQTNANITGKTFQGFVLYRAVA